MEKKARPERADGPKVWQRCAPAPPQASPADPQGSYTGRPVEPGETPVQDADDL